MPTISFPDNKRLMRAIRVLSGEKGRSVASLAEQAFQTAFGSDIERIMTSPFFDQEFSDLRQTSHQGEEVIETKAVSDGR